MDAPIALGLDLGTSGLRGVAVTATGERVAEAQASYPLLTPRPGWTEQDPADWREAGFAVLSDLATQLSGREILALGLSGQMHGLVPLDGRGEVVRNAILWNDQRTAEAVGEMLERVPREVFIARTGNPPITGFFGSKLLWLRRAEPENFARTRHALLPKDYLGYLLTGVLASEPTDDSGTNLFDLARKRWDEEILAALELPPSLFPEVVASQAVTGKLGRAAAVRTGLPEGLPVVAGAGDNAAAATGLGLGSQAPELGSVSLGTSGVVFAPLAAATPDPQGRVHLFGHADGGYALVGVTLSAAGSLRWFRDTLAPGTSFDALDAEARSSPPGSNGVTFKPYLAGERSPHLDPELRGSFRGLSLANTRGDLVRAVLEGVAFSLREVLEIIRPLAPIGEALATGGGARSALWLELLADVLELPLALPAQNRGAAYGAALLALQGVGALHEAAAAAPRARLHTVAPRRPETYRAARAAYQVFRG